MPFCPNCGSQVSEGTRFCPECGRPFTIVGQVGSGEHKNKKIAGIILACVIAIIVIVVIATRPPARVEPEPAIPTHFATYTDELGLFSISYPPEWELDLESMGEIRQFSQDIISSITSDVSIEETHMLFMAGLPVAGGHIPNVNIVVEPVYGMRTHEQVVAAGIEGLKAVVSDYHEFSRVRTTIDKRTATIIDCEASVPELGIFRFVIMCCIVNNTGWAVTCTALPEDYAEWQDDFDGVIRSLRIHK